jgi:hypothetical protein
MSKSANLIRLIVEKAERRANVRVQRSKNIEVRQLYELDDLGSSESIQRFRKIGVETEKK